MNRMLLFAIGLPLAAVAGTRTLTLEEAIALAQRQNSLLKIAQHKSSEASQKVQEVRASYYPLVRNDTAYFYATQLQRVSFPAGALGVFPEIGPIPAASITLFQGARNYLLSSTAVAQPLTQLYKVRQGEAVARADAQIAEESLRRGRQDVTFGVEQLYFGLLIAQRQLHAAGGKIASAEEHLRDAANAVESGNTLAVSELGRKAQFAEARQARLSLQIQTSDLMVELNDLMGLPLDTQLELTPPSTDLSPLPPLAALVEQGAAANPQVREAQQLIDKARGGVNAARAEYIPELTAIAQYVAQSGVPFFPVNNFIAGGQLRFDIWDWGKRSAVIKQRQSQLAIAEENLKRVRSRVAADIEKSHRKLERSVQLAAVAREAFTYRAEAARIARDQSTAGMATQGAYLEAEAARASAEADVFAADLGTRLARAELDKAIGAH